MRNCTFSRFLIKKRWIRRDGSISPDAFGSVVKPDAFVPCRRGEVSVSCCDELEEEILWEYGRQVVEQRRNESASIQLFGRADFIGTRVPEPLYIETAPLENNPHHCNIKGWPDFYNDRDLRADCLRYQQELAQASVYINYSVISD